MDKLNYEIREYRYHRHTNENLCGFLIGFLITNENSGLSITLSTLVKDEHAKNKNEQEIIEIAFSQLKPEIQKWYNESSGIKMVGKKFNPTSDINYGEKK